MKNKHVKQMIATLVGGKWVVKDQLTKPTVMVSVLSCSDDWRAFIAFHRVVSLTAEQMEK